MESRCKSIVIANSAPKVEYLFRNYYLEIGHIYLSLPNRWANISMMKVEAHLPIYTPCDQLCKLNVPHLPNLRSRPHSISKMCEIKNSKDMLKSQLKSECHQRGILNTGVKLDLITSLYYRDLAIIKRSISETIANMNSKVDPHAKRM